MNRDAVRNKYIELLSPARNYNVGVAAVNHGADAVYIGPDRFGARVAAGNSVADIERLVRYAHRYRARVYVTLNTILMDSELEAARKLVYELYNVGADALIVQDMSLLMMDLPPIPLHASTQCDNRTVDKVKFLEQCGFCQVVLARETPLDTMRRIAAGTTVLLEAFVHGALCVSYSGQCYMSQAVKGRSANRGACAQMCRLPYTLTDEQGNVYARDRHLLSLKDFDASHSLCGMIDAGISSFKIEGRLKDEMYVKNITAYYRKKLDDILAADGERRMVSSGKTTFFFTPDPKKTFYRGATDYFLNGRQPDIWQFDTPKSMGEPVGKVCDIWRNALGVDSSATFANGDGICFVDAQGGFVGFRINRVEQNRLIPFCMPENVRLGTLLYRNSDAEFEKLLRGKTAERRIEVKISVTDTPDDVEITMTDEDGIRSRVFLPKSDCQIPKDAVKAERTWREQLSKLGDTVYRATDVDLSGMSELWFLPVSELADARRRLTECHDAQRENIWQRQHVAVPENDTSEKKFETVGDCCGLMPQKMDYRANVANKLAREFYRTHGIRIVEPAFEISKCDNVELMRTKHCIRFAMGWCAKSTKYAGTAPQRLFIRNGQDKFELHFDCRACEMVVKLLIDK